MPSLILKPGPAYRGDFYHPGYSEGNRHVIRGFPSIGAANAAGFRYFRKGIAASWSVATERGLCTLHSWNHDPYTGKKVYRESDFRKSVEDRPMATMEYCPYPDQSEVHPREPCFYCTWVTTRELIFNVIGDRPVRPTTATPAIDGRGNQYGYRCHSGNHVWYSWEDADKCCTGRYQRGLGEWIPIPAVV